MPLNRNFTVYASAFLGAICLIWLGFGQLRPDTQPKKANQENQANSVVSDIGDAPTSNAPQGAVTGGKEHTEEQVKTEIVRRLLAKLDELSDIPPDTRRQLRKVLLESDAQLAQATQSREQVGRNEHASLSQEQPARKESGAEKTPAPQPQSEKSPRSPVIRALLDLLAGYPEGQTSQEARHQRDALREALLRADEQLALYLGKSAAETIKRANQKPPVPRVYNPRPKSTPEKPNQAKNERQ